MLTCSCGTIPRRNAGQAVMVRYQPSQGGRSASRPHEDQRALVVEIVGGGDQLRRDIVVGTAALEDTDGLRQQAAGDDIVADAFGRRFAERGFGMPRHELMGAHGQCDMRTGAVMPDSRVRLAPPSTISRSREWP